MVETVKPQRRIQEGSYVFRFEEDLRYDDFYYKNRKGIDTKGQKAVLVLRAITEDEEIDFEDQFPVWDQRYTDLLKAFNIEHGSEFDFTGMTFEADIKYEPDPKKPNRSWPHLFNIRPTRLSSEDNKDDSEIPF